MAKRRTSRRGLRGTQAEHLRTADQFLDTSQHFIVQRSRTKKQQCTNAIRAHNAAAQAQAEALWGNDTKQINQTEKALDKAHAQILSRCGCKR